MNCDKMRDWMSLYIDNLLDDNEIKEFEKHLRECKNCTNDFSQLLDIMDEVHSLPEKELPPDFHHTLMNQIIEIVNQEKNTPAKKSRWYMRPKWVSSLAAAILILFIVGGAGLSGIFNPSQMSQNESVSEPNMGISYDTASQESGGQEKVVPQFTGMTKEAPSVSSVEDANDTQNEIAIQFSEELAESKNQHKDEERNSKVDLMDEKESEQLAINDDSSTIDRKKIIKNANIHLEVEKFDEIIEQIRTLTEQSGGYIENANSSIYHSNPDREEYLKEGYMVLRLPKEEYGVARQTIFDMGHVVNQSENAVNVTQQYMETESRIRMLQVQEQRLLDIMEKAEKVEDLIKLEERLNTIRTELEVYQTNIQNWDQLVEFSTIRVSIRQVKKQEKLETVPPNFKTKIKEGIIGSVNNLKNNIELFILKVARHFMELIIYGIGLIIILWLLRPFLKRWLNYIKAKK